jgi:uridine kinase
MTTVVGVSGGSGSGKSTVSRRLREAVGPERMALVMQDSYYRDLPSHDEAAILAHNFDHPDSLELELLAHHLAELKAGRAVDVPVYDFVTHTRSAEVQRVEPGPVVLVEGILLFAVPELVDVFDLRVFVDTDADVRLARRVRRDVAERGRTAGDVLRQWEETVRPMHLEFVEPSRRWADVIVPEGGMNRAALALLQDHLAKLLDG